MYDEIKSVWYEIKVVFVCTWEYICSIFTTDEGYSSGGPAPGCAFVRGTECVVSRRQLLNGYTSLELLEEILKRQSEENK